MTKVTVTAVLTFPAASCWVTDAVWVPSASVGEVQVQLPPADTVAWQRGDPDRVTESTAPGSPRPENTGRATLEGVGTGSTVGAAIEVFTTNRSGFDAGEVELPRLIVATRRWDPSASLLDTLHDHCRLETFATVQSVLPFSLTDSDTSPSSSSSSSSSLPEHTEEVPVRVGDESLVGEGVWSMVGAARPWVRTTKSIPCEVNPAASIRAVQVWTTSRPSVAVTATALPEAALLRPEKTTFFEVTTRPWAGSLGVSTESACESRAARSQPSEPQPQSRSAKGRTVLAAEDSFTIPSSYARRANSKSIETRRLHAPREHLRAVRHVRTRGQVVGF